MSRIHADAQNAFHDRLSRYVNGAFASRATLLLALLAPALAYRREAPGMAAGFRDTAPARRADSAAQPIDVAVPLYDGPNAAVRKLMAGLAPLSTHLAGAYVHGSIATNEEIAYSDFDALVILRSSVFESADMLSRIAGRLGALRRLMFEYDPLQHHGWFVLLEDDLQNYCQAWFPIALFPWSRSLLPDAGRQLRIWPRDSSMEYRHVFASLAASTLRQIEGGPPLHNAYRLKGLMSQFMLLPAVYLQARDGTARFKKQSFALAAADFPPAAWSAMERVSAARLAWHYEVTATQRLALTRCVAQRPLVTRWVRPVVPADVRAALSPQLWATAAGLIRAMQERVGGSARG